MINLGLTTGQNGGTYNLDLNVKAWERMNFECKDTCPPQWMVVDKYGNANSGSNHRIEGTVLQVSTTRDINEFIYVKPYFDQTKQSQCYNSISTANANAILPVHIVICGSEVISTVSTNSLNYRLTIGQDRDITIPASEYMGYF
jgi:hypothetical protein